MKSILVAIVAAVLFVGLSASTLLGQATGSAALYERLVETLSRGDIDAALALFTDDVVRKGGQACARGCVGIAELRKEYETQKRNNTQVTVIGPPQVSGNRLEAREEVRADQIRAAGVERIIILKTVDVRGDKISLIQIRADMSDPATAAFVRR